MSIRMLLVNDPNSGIADAELEPIADACEQQLHIDLPATFPQGSGFERRLVGLRVECAHRVAPRSDDWRCEILPGYGFPKPSLGGSAGRHSVRGTPSAPLPFAVVDPMWAACLSATISHELVEVLCNPYLLEHVRFSDGTALSYEPCDPVACDWYERDGVKLCNIVTASWYGIPGVDRFDHMGLLSAPRQVRPGGYAPTCLV